MLLSVSLVAAMFTLPLSAFADPTKETPSENQTTQQTITTQSDLSPERKLTDKELEIMNRAVPSDSIIENKIGSNDVSILAAVMSYNILKLSSGNTKYSDASFYLPPGKKPTLTLVQSPYSGGPIPGNCDVYYTLVDVDTNNWINDGVRVSKNYTSTNFSYTFSNVPTDRTYKVVISNYPDAYDMKGNGYITL